MNNAKLTAQTVRSEMGIVAFVCTLETGDGTICQRTMSIDDFVTLIQGATRRVTTSKLRVGAIPEGFVDGFVSNDAGTLGAIIKVPSQKHQFVLNYDGKRKSYYLPMPNLLYTIYAYEGNITDFRCYTYRHWEGMDTDICQYPFGNVSLGGSVCTGSIQSRKIKNFMDCALVIEDTLCGETNKDYLRDHDDKVNLAKSIDQFSFCDELEKMEEFPHNLLLSKKESVGTVIQDFFKLYA